MSKKAASAKKEVPSKREFVGIEINIGSQKSRYPDDVQQSLSGCTRERAIEVINEIFDKVPAGARDAVLSSETVSERGDRERDVLYVQYTRDLTPEEISKKEAEAEHYRVLQAERDRQDYARLSAKLGIKP